MLKNFSTFVKASPETPSTVTRTMTDALPLAGKQRWVRAQRETRTNVVARFNESIRRVCIGDLSPHCVFESIAGKAPDESRFYPALPTVTSIAFSTEAGYLFFGNRLPGEGWFSWWLPGITGKDATGFEMLMRNRTRSCPSSGQQPSWSILWRSRRSRMTR